MGAFGRSEFAEAQMRLWDHSRLLVLATGLVCAVLLALPGITVTTKSLDELFLVIAGIHRVIEGQIPSLDFDTPLGPLAYYGPAAGYALAGSFGAAMPAMMGLMTAFMTLIAAHVLISRLHPFLAVAFAAFLLLILAAPMNLGDPVTALSFAMFYNRIAWAALALLLVLYLGPSRTVGYQTIADAACATALSLVMIYLRPAYGLVAVSFLLFMITDQRQRGWVGLAAVLIAATVLVVEFFWGATSLYARHAWRAIQATGSLGEVLQQLAQAALAHLADLLLLVFLAGLTLWRRWSLRDFLFLLFCSIAGLWLFSHNVQRWGVISIHAAAAVAAERLLREMSGTSQTKAADFVNRSGVKLYFLAFVLPTILHCGMALALHTGAAAARSGQAFGIPRMSEIRVADLGTGGDFAGASHFLSIVKDGLALLSRQKQPIGPLAVAGSVDVFSSALDLPSSRAQLSDLRWRNGNAVDGIPPARALADVELVIFRKTGASPVGAAADYLAFLSASYSKVAESQYWMLFRRHHPGSGVK